MFNRIPRCHNADDDGAGVFALLQLVSGGFAVFFITA